MFTLKCSRQHSKLYIYIYIFFFFLLYLRKKMRFDVCRHSFRVFSVCFVCMCACVRACVRACCCCCFCKKTRLHISCESSLWFPRQAKFSWEKWEKKNKTQCYLLQFWIINILELQLSKTSFSKAPNFMFIFIFVVCCFFLFFFVGCVCVCVWGGGGGGVVWHSFSVLTLIFVQTWNTGRTVFLHVIPQPHSFLLPWQHVIMQIDIFISDILYEIQTTICIY